MGMLRKINKGLIKLAIGIIPLKIFNQLKSIKHKKQHEKFLKKMINQIIKHHINSSDREVIEVLDFFKTNPITVFSYNFIKKYKKEDIEIIQDHELGLKYVIHQGKNYFLNAR